MSLERRLNRIQEHLDRADSSTSGDSDRSALEALRQHMINHPEYIERLRQQILIQDTEDPSYSDPEIRRIGEMMIQCFETGKPCELCGKAIQ